MNFLFLAILLFGGKSLSFGAKFKPFPLLVVTAPKGRAGMRAGKGRELEGRQMAGVKHYGTDTNKLMRGMVEVQRQGGKRVFFKSEQTKTGTIETRLIIPDTPDAGLTQVGDTQLLYEGPEQSEQQSLAAEVGPEEEMALPNKQFVQ